MLALWAAIGCVPWFIGLVAANARDAQWRMLPVAAIFGMGGAALVPALVRKDALGFAMSLVAALVAGSALTMIATGLARDRRAR